MKIHHRRVDPATASARSAALLVAMIGVLCLAGCGQSATETVDPPSASASAQDERDARTLELWSRSCSLCHASGAGGAPTIGDSATWQRLLVSGEDLLLRHTIEGFNNMPPLGYCMDCEREDFSALIRFMALNP